MGKEVQLAHNIETRYAILSESAGSSTGRFAGPGKACDQQKNFSETSARKESDKRYVEMEKRLKKRMAEQLKKMNEGQKERDG